jgi:hypothetical protein
MYDIANDLFAWEAGELDEDEEIELFQALVDNGMAWSLQGMYGRRAMMLIKAGLVEVNNE